MGYKTNNAKKYFDWMADRTIESLIEFINAEGNDLNQRMLARAIPLSESTLRLNTTIAKHLSKLKDDMRNVGLLPPKPDACGSKQVTDSPVCNSVLNRRERKELQDLRVLVVQLKEQNISLTQALMRYEKMEQYLAEFGVLPR